MAAQVGSRVIRLWSRGDTRHDGGRPRAYIPHRRSVCEAADDGLSMYERSRSLDLDVLPERNEDGVCEGVSVIGCAVRDAAHVHSGRDRQVELVVGRLVDHDLLVPDEERSERTVNSEIWSLRRWSTTTSTVHSMLAAYTVTCEGSLVL